MTKRLLLYLPGVALWLVLLLSVAVLSLGLGKQLGRADAQPTRWTPRCQVVINGQTYTQNGEVAACGFFDGSLDVLVRVNRR